MRGNLLSAAEHRGDRGGTFPEEMARAIVIEGLREGLARWRADPDAT